MANLADAQMKSDRNEDDEQSQEFRRPEQNTWIFDHDVFIWEPLTRSTQRRHTPAHAADTHRSQRHFPLNEVKGLIVFRQLIVFPAADSEGKPCF